MTHLPHSKKRTAIPPPLKRRGILARLGEGKKEPPHHALLVVGGVHLFAKESSFIRSSHVDRAHLSTQGPRSADASGLAWRPLPFEGMGASQ
jgi:hypothetical protein